MSDVSWPLDGGWNKSNLAAPDQFESAEKLVVVYFERKVLFLFYHKLPKKSA